MFFFSNFFPKNGPKSYIFAINSVENAKNFLKMKLGIIEQIAQGTGLSVDEVQKLSLEIKNEN